MRSTTAEDEHSTWKITESSSAKLMRICDLLRAAWSIEQGNKNMETTAKPRAALDDAEVNRVIFYECFGMLLEITTCHVIPNAVAAGGNFV